MAEHVRADALRRNSCIRGHLPNDLKQANAAEMRPAAREQPRRSGRRMIEPSPDGAFRARRDRDQPFLAPLAADNQEGLALADGAAGQANQFARAETRTVKEFEQCEIANGGELAARR